MYSMYSELQKNLLFSEKFGDLTHFKNISLEINFSRRFSGACLGAVVGVEDGVGVTRKLQFLP